MGDFALVPDDRDLRRSQCAGKHLIPCFAKRDGRIQMNAPVLVSSQRDVIEKAEEMLVEMKPRGRQTPYHAASMSRGE